MSNLKTILTITAVSLFAGSACAQDTDYGSATTELAATMEADFNAADLDQDSALNADEFVSFAVMRAESGEAAYADLVLSGDYETTFAAHDADASGTLSAQELGGKADMDESLTSDDMDEMDEMDETVEPEL